MYEFYRLSVVVYKMSHPIPLLFAKAIDSQFCVFRALM